MRLSSFPVRPLKAAVCYFGIVFGVGFVLGPIRVVWAVPRFGERVAELLEAPLMLVAMIWATQWTVRRFRLRASVPSLVGTGVTALALLLFAELTVVLKLRDLTLSAYVAGRDPVSGGVYLVMLGLFAAMPWLVGRHSG